MYSIYNQSSAMMDQVPDASVDLVVTSPPYNIGTAYGRHSDKLPQYEYKDMVNHSLKECVRALCLNGRLVLQVADTLYMRGNYIQYAGFLTRLIMKMGMSLGSRHFALVSTCDGIELPEELLNKTGRSGELWEEYGTFTEQAQAHSNTHQWLVFVKGSVEWNPKGEILYFNSVPENGHPCPFGNGEITFVLDRYLSPGGVVLDPFMGIAKLGVEVVRRGGSFIGYELSPGIYAVAKRNLRNAK